MFIGLCVVFCLFSTVLFSLNPDRKPILNPKIGEPVMQSLTEGIKFVFNNKTVLGAITLDMVAVLFGGGGTTFFSQDILKVGSEDLAFTYSPAHLLTMLITAYVPLSRNAGMKLLTAIFGFGICIIVLDYLLVFN
jgi:hypothetical protein